MKKFFILIWRIYWWIFPIIGISTLSDELKEAYRGNYDQASSIFSLMQLMKRDSGGAIFVD
jgi:hypothetical protein